jgi:uncharacterized protein YdaU (DUF1376 family)
MPMYWPNYLADTADFTTVEHGAYLLLIAHYWCNGSLPDDNAKLARIAKLSPQQWSKIRGHVAQKFTEQWKHNRIEQEHAKALIMQERGRERRRRAAEKKRQKADAVLGYTYTNTYKDSKSEAGAETIKPGFAAVPHTAEFNRWKDWAFKHNVPLWRELMSRETEGRAFDFEAQWPPN